MVSERLVHLSVLPSAIKTGKDFRIRGAAHTERAARTATETRDRGTGELKAGETKLGEQNGGCL